MEVANFLDSLALEEQTFTIIPHMSVSQLLVAALVFWSCTISQAEEGGRDGWRVRGRLLLDRGRGDLARERDF